MKALICFMGEVAAPPTPAAAIEDSVLSRSWTMKMAVDLILSILIFILTLPILLVAMVLVKLTSRGPAIYSQTRVGLHGRLFTIYKVRTMVRDSERLSGACWSLPGDRRVTLVGRVLRATHVDELPQLWNVFRGEMSLVGPRPERPELMGELERAIPCYRDRLRVLPGVTGLAQVQLPPDVDLTSVRRKLACDLYYARHASLWLDLRLMLSTAIAVVGIPFAVPRALLRIPSGAAVEKAYRDLSAREMTISQVQPA